MGDYGIPKGFQPYLLQRNRHRYLLHGISKESPVFDFLDLFSKRDLAQVRAAFKSPLSNHQQAVRERHAFYLLMPLERLRGYDAHALRNRYLFRIPSIGHQDTARHQEVSRFCAALSSLRVSVRQETVHPQAVFKSLRLHTHDTVRQRHVP